MTANKILVTGGAGYIGSHTCVALVAAGYEVVVFDNFSNARRSVLERVASLCGKPIACVEGDIRDAQALDGVFAEHSISAVIHFAGLKAVGESVEQPLRYYDNNVHGSVQLFAAMQRAGVEQLVFSSSATVYGEQPVVPFVETMPTSATNPYGRSKLMVEEVLTDLHRSRVHLRTACLRYFNPVGAHESGLIGEDPQGIPNNLLPFVAQVAAGQREYLNVWGNDYPTSDGTGVRDYIHVEDLAAGHVAALAFLQHNVGMHIINLGTGVGYSVLEMVAAFEKASGRAVPYRIAPRRAGDIAKVWADPARASELLGWRTTRNLDAMCADAWRWQAWAASHLPPLVS
jgi:UDP-glucose 4-epimerase